MSIVFTLKWILLRAFFAPPFQLKTFFFHRAQIDFHIMIYWFYQLAAMFSGISFNLLHHFLMSGSFWYFGENSASVSFPFSFKSIASSSSPFLSPLKCGERDFSNLMAKFICWLLLMVDCESLVCPPPDDIRDSSPEFELPNMSRILWVSICCFILPCNDSNQIINFNLIYWDRKFCFFFSVLRLENPAQNNLKIKMLINKLIDDKIEKNELRLSVPWQFLVLRWNFNFYLCVYWSHFDGDWGIYQDEPSEIESWKCFEWFWRNQFDEEDEIKNQVDEIWEKSEFK